MEATERPVPAMAVPATEITEATETDRMEITLTEMATDRMEITMETVRATEAEMAQTEMVQTEMETKTDPAMAVDGEPDRAVEHTIMSVCRMRSETMKI